MVRLLPFVGHIVADAGAHAVVAPPYDALTAEQRAAMAAADPRSFLNVLPPAGPEADRDLDHTLRACRRSLDRLLHDGHFRPIATPSLAVVAFGGGEERIAAVIGDVEVGAFALPPAPATPGSILPHERVRDDRVQQLVRYLEQVQVASSPVALTHRPDAAVDTALAAVTTTPPDVAYRDEDDTDVALWLVDDPARIQSLTAAIEAAGTLYLADGHHRVAAVAAHAPVTGRVLAAIVPGQRVQILPFHRRIEGLGSERQGEPDQVLALLRTRGLDPQALPGPTTPTDAGTAHVTVGGRWFCVDLRSRAVTDDPVERLDVRLVERELVAPLLAAADGGGTAPDPTADPRVVAVAAPLGLAALEAPDAVGIALPAPALEDLLRVADAGAVMPAKTTYVLPKQRSGLLVVPRSASGH